MAHNNNRLALAELPSLGETSASLLAEVGIHDRETLQQHGAVGSFLVLRMQFGKRITLNWVYALECAILGIDWRLLQDERKAELRAAARKVIRDLEKME